MPIYEFECKTCSHITEYLFRGYDNTQIIVCENCNAPAYRIISRHTPLWWNGLVDQARKDKLPETKAYRYSKKINFEREKGRRKKAKYKILNKKADRAPSPAMTVGPAGTFGGGARQEVKIEEKDKPYL